jgi:hypothetical protein
MNATQDNLKPLCMTAAPSLVLVLLYLACFHFPARSGAHQLNLKQLKLQAAVTRLGSDGSTLTTRLAAAQAEQGSLTAELESLQSAGEQLVSTRVALRDHLFRTATPAQRVARASEIFRRHQLECLDTAGLPPTPGNTSRKPQPPTTSTLGSVAELLGRSGTAFTPTSTAGNTAATTGIASSNGLSSNAGAGSGGVLTDAHPPRREVRMTLLGSYDSMCAALRELVDTAPDIFTLSIQMEPRGPEAKQRVWILTILV